MELIILTDSNFLDVKTIRHAVIDIDVGDSNDFQLIIRRAEYSKQFAPDNFVYAPNTEFGGMIGEVDTDTSLDTITFQGITWRGMLDKKIISPLSGDDYRTVSGELNSIIRSLIDSEFSNIIVGSAEDTGRTVSSFQFDRYCTVLEGLKKMLKSVGYKLQINLVQSGLGTPNQVIVSAVPIVDYSSEIELSQDQKLNFRFENKYNGVNHLICLGQGELAQRTVIDLYVDKTGNIGTTKYFTGIKEIVEVYDYSSAESTADLREKGIERLQEIMNSQTFEMDVASIDTRVEIGDIIGGKDYLTGITAKQPVKAKVWRQENGVENLTYKVEGEQA